MRKIILLWILPLMALNLVDCELSTSGLDILTDDDLIESIKSNEFVIVLFSKQQCIQCENIETKLFNLRDDFEQILQAKLVKVVNSQLLRLYTTASEPAIVFFRKGVPLLYDGPFESEEIFMRFNDNRAPAVQELTDEIFEHLTQASTGATTGDWLILFQNRECIECQRISALWEAVGAATRNRLNVARIDKDYLGVKTAKRFKVHKVPEFILIRQGYFYRYEIPRRDVKSFVSFATEFYRNSRAEKIPVAPSPFDDLVSKTVEFIKHIQTNGFSGNQLMLLIISSIIGFVIGFILLFFHFKKKLMTAKKSTNKKTN